MVIYMELLENKTFKLNFMLNNLGDKENTRLSFWLVRLHFFPARDMRTISQSGTHSNNIPRPRNCLIASNDIHAINIYMYICIDQTLAVRTLLLFLSPLLPFVFLVGTLLSSMKCFLRKLLHHWLVSGENLYASVKYLLPHERPL